MLIINIVARAVWQQQIKQHSKIRNYSGYTHGVMMFVMKPGLKNRV